MIKIYFIFLLVFLSVIGCSKTPDVIWRFKTNGPVYVSPALSGNQLIVGSNDHNLYALDLKSGKVPWKTDLGERILMTPLAEKNDIYVGTASGYVYQIHANDGSTGWKFKANAMLEFDPCSDSDGIYFGAHDGNFYKINREGQLLWSLQTGYQVTSSCTFYKDKVITTSWDTNIYCLRRDTGEVVWKVPTVQFNYGNGVVVGDSIFFGTHDTFYRIDAASGKILFKKNAAYNTHLLAFQNFIYTQENGLSKRSLDGSVVKNVSFKAFSEFPPALVNGYIVMAGTPDTLYGISTNLEILWKYRAKDLFWSSGVLHDGIYYIGNLDSYVYALSLPS